MKISSNNNLIPYFKDPYDVIPAVSPEMEKLPNKRRQAVTKDNYSYQTDSNKYYIKTDGENAVYNSRRRLVSQLPNQIGMLIDTFV